MANNAGRNIRGTQEAGSWDAFDRLPVEIKRLIQEAPLNYSTRSVPGMLRKIGKAKLIEIMRANMARDVRAAARMDYGPDHPQAQA